RAEALFERAGATHVTYLLVPDFHHAHPLTDDREFMAWCARPRPFTIEWALHGYYHLEDAAPRHRRGGLGGWIARRTMTAGEAEFLALSAPAQRERLIRGRDMCAAVLGVAPRAFVAPAWLFNRELTSELARLGFRYTEDHWNVIDVQRNA